ncbi:MAG: Holliday junction branch migration protein RuvA [Spirochaetaceae bacterium]|nr:Holliday junction branch migration protein RuvA [Spirochaetaceae bacterium]
MFNSISGTITYKGASVVYLENNGIEWEIHTSSKSISLIPSINNNARIMTYLHVREDNITLYGFNDEKERSLFFELIKINGIGPKQALKILSGISVDDFISALDSENISLLSTLPGIGQKTAQKIVLAMRGKLLKDSIADVSASSSQYNDIIKALTDMGFEYRKASKTVEIIAKEDDIKNLDFAEKEKAILKKAIIALSSM